MYNSFYVHSVAWYQWRIIYEAHDAHTSGLLRRPNPEALWLTLRVLPHTPWSPAQTVSSWVRRACYHLSVITDTITAILYRHYIRFTNYNTIFKIISSLLFVKQQNVKQRQMMLMSIVSMNRTAAYIYG